MKKALVFVFILLQTVIIFSENVSFQVGVDSSLTKENQTYSGKLLILITNSSRRLQIIHPNFMNPKAVYVASTDANHLGQERTFDFHSNATASPEKISALPAGKYQVMAVLDRDWDFGYHFDMDGGDLYSDVVPIEIPTQKISLTLSKVVPKKKPSLPENVHVVEFESSKLSNFWGRSIKMQASVLLPPNYKKGDKSYPTVYDVHGFGGSHTHAIRHMHTLNSEMRQGTRPEMIYVYLNGNCSLGHHVFADSANNGPWGTALVKEFIPHLEQKFRMDTKPKGRFLTGHSSGGWSTLWIMITHPEFFGGVWSTAPDPVDFRHFTGPNLTLYPPQNMYANDKGEPYTLVRFQGREVMSIEQFVVQERAFGSFGGQFASFEAVFSPKGRDGQPMPIFCRETGIIDPVVQKAWEKYDIARTLQNNWQELGPKLQGKIRIIVGTKDTFYLNEAVLLLEKVLKELKSDAVIEYIEGGDHFNIYENDLSKRIAREMYKVARPEE
ncbi:alpha/beta hydrolase [Candidatus Uabimicrobium sp. HlEnr_7]|uniref:alpha/beta hydrolase n=1 Tax=Candidatus Uabimicrobium helgolandensis TaxID=3095367 RepID=UPI0035585272